MELIKHKTLYGNFLSLVALDVSIYESPMAMLSNKTVSAHIHVLYLYGMVVKVKRAGISFRRLAEPLTFSPRLLFSHAASFSVRAEFQL